MFKYKKVLDEFFWALLEELNSEKKLFMLCNLLNKLIPTDEIAFIISDKLKSEMVRIYSYKNEEIKTMFLKDNKLPEFSTYDKILPKVTILDKDPEDFALFEQHLGVFFPKARSAALVSIQENLDLFFSFILISEKSHTYTAWHEKLLLYFYDIIEKITEEFILSTKEFGQIISAGLDSPTSYELLKLCKGLKKELKLAEKAAKSDLPVLLIGESGVGKELFADTIHFLSKRKSTPLIKVNCAAISENLFDSEFFGHEKGSFTSAASQHLGHFERANRGTIFLDEIGELSLNVQAKLLRILENNEFMRVGGTRNISVDVRCIFATNRNLDSQVKAGKFREDLWYRLDVLPIYIPSLKERQDDIKTLAEHFYRTNVHKLQINNPPVLSQQVLNQLYQNEWLGNVRELKHAIERSLIYYPNKKELEFDFHRTYKSRYQKTRTIEEVSKELIQEALEKCQGRVHGPNGAARLLKINPSTLRSKMKKLEILA